MVFSGVCTALVTPFLKDKSVDFCSLQKLIEHQIKNKVDAILILGTTGESSTISFEERKQIILFSKSIINGRCKLIVGAGSNSTAQAVSLCKQAKELGVNSVLVVSPYYNKCTQEGIIEHYKQIDRVNINFFVYNVPSRTGVNIEPKTYEKLCKLKNMCGIKEANGDIKQILSVFENQKITCPIYCGNDELNFVFSSLGASGTISVLSNANVGLVKEIFQNKNRDLFLRYINLCKLLFVEPNPIPIKYVLSKLNLIENNLRLPLTKLSKTNEKKIDKFLEGEICK